jgi:DNA-binding PucR family transcriptional regulator
VAAVGDVALERAISADAALARAAVAHWLGPLERSPRTGSELVETLEAWFEAGESITGAARRLHLAPRTVSYRLERIARLLGHQRLEGEVRLRLATALLLRRLVGPQVTPATDASPVPPR